MHAVNSRFVKVILRPRGALTYLYSTWTRLTGGTMTNRCFCYIRGEYEFTVLLLYKVNLQPFRSYRCPTLYPRSYLHIPTLKVGRNWGPSGDKTLGTRLEDHSCICFSYMFILIPIDTSTRWSSFIKRRTLPVSVPQFGKR